MGWMVSGVVKLSSRFMALFIDLLLLFCFHGALVIVTCRGIVQQGAADFFSLSSFVQLFTVWAALLLVGMMAAGMVYFTIMHALCGQTIGKMLMGIQIESQAGNGVSMGMCFVRWVGYFSSALPFFIGFWWALLDKEGRTWHDRLAGTRVIYKAP